MTIRLVYLTTCRSDYGPASWLLRDLAADPRVQLELWVSGAHLTSGTEQEILDDGLAIARRLPFSVDDHARGAAEALTGAASLLAQHRPDLVLLYGDRHELLPLATAAVLGGMPIGHFCGGDVTEGAIDEQVRHALTKLAHLHFATSARSAARIRQMGEEPWRVHDVGDPSLDQFRRGERAGVAELEKLLGFRPDGQTLLVTWHPATLALDRLQADTRALTDALAAHPGGIVVTAPAPDPGADEIRRALRAFVDGRPRTAFVESLGSRRYRGLLAIAGAMVGNSSSGLSEAPCVPLPVVNIGDRQAGRDRARNVIDVPADTSAVGDAIRHALDPAFRASLAGLKSPYGDGLTSGRVVEILARLPDRATLLRKKFVELRLGARDPRPAIGGDFALEGDWPWQGGDPTLFAAGRDALAAIVHGSARDGRPWLVPAFLCPVVPETLRAAGVAPLAYPWTTPWQADLRALEPLLDGAAGIVVPFHMGLPPDQALWKLLDGRSLVVVEDRCQCVGLPPAPDSLHGDWAIGSLRKWAPVPDGAWCVGRRGRVQPSELVATAMVRLRVAAGLAKAAFADLSVDAAVENAYVALFRAGETAAGAAAKPRRASGVASRIFAGLDVPALIARRLHNQRQLARALAPKLWEPSPGAIVRSELPLLAIPLLVDDRDALRARLAAERVFAPVHWTDGDWSGGGGAAAEWSARTLSIPIDHRLGDAELERLADLIG